MMDYLVEANRQLDLLNEQEQDFNDCGQPLPATPLLVPTKKRAKYDYTGVDWALVSQRLKARFKTTPPKQEQAKPFWIEKAYDPSGIIEKSRNYTLSLIERYNLHAFTLRAVSDHASIKLREDRKAASFAGYKERAYASSLSTCHTWTQHGGGLGVMGGDLESWAHGFPDVSLLSEQEKDQYSRIRHKQVFVLDVDNCFLSTAFEVMPSLANIPYVTRTDNPNKGKFLFLTHVMSDVVPYQFKVTTNQAVNDVMFEVKDMGAVWGKHPANGHYIWSNIEELDITQAHLMTVDMPTFEAFCTQLENACIDKFAVDKVAAKKSQLSQATKRAEKKKHIKIYNGQRYDGTRRNKKHPLPDLPILPERTDLEDLAIYDAGFYRPNVWKEWRRKINPLATLSYALKHLNHENVAYWNGPDQIKITGHGGLHVNTKTGGWIVYGDSSLSGGLPELIAYHQSWKASQSDGSALSSQASSNELKLASVWAGVPYPKFRTYARPISKPPILSSEYWQWLLSLNMPPFETFTLDGIQDHVIVDSPIEELPSDGFTWLDVEPFIEEWIYASFVWFEPIPVSTLEPVLPFGLQAIELHDKKIGQVVNVADIFDARDWHLFQAPTGRGKTYAMCDQFTQKIAIACPTQDLAKQIAKEYGLSLVMEGVQVDFSLGRIATTYDGLQKIKRQAIKQDINLSDWTLAIDEIHHIVTDAFRVPAIRSMMIIAQDFGRVIGMSATLPPSLPFFENAPVTRLVAPMPEKPLYRALVPDYTGLILDTLKTHERVIMHLNNKHIGQAIKDELARSDVSCELFNSSTKEDDHHEKMIMIGDVPDCKVLIVTSLFDDGYSFFDGKSYALILTSSSRLSPFQIEQISARIRNNPPKSTILARRADVVTSEYDEYFFSYTGFLERKRRQTAFRCKQYNERLAFYANDYAQERLLDGRDLTALARAQVIEDGGLSGLIWNEQLEEWQADEVAIHQAAFSAWQSHCNKRPDRMIAELARYGFVYKGDWQADIDEKEAKTRNKRLKRGIAQSRSDEQLTIAIEVNKIEELGAAERLAENFNNKTNGNQAIYKAANFLIRLYDAGLTFECAQERLLDGRKLSKNEVKNLESVVRFRKMKTHIKLGVPSLTDEAAFYRALLSAFKADDILTSRIISDAFEQALIASKQSPIVHDAYWNNDLKKQQRKRAALIKKMFSTQRRSASKEELSLFEPDLDKVGHENEQKVPNREEKEQNRVPLSEEKQKNKARPKVLVILDEPDDLYELRAVAPSLREKDHIVDVPIETEKQSTTQAAFLPENEQKTDRQKADYAYMLADQCLYKAAKQAAKKIKDKQLKRRTLGYIKSLEPKTKKKKAA